MLPGREARAALSKQGSSSACSHCVGKQIKQKKPRSPPALAEAAAVPATAQPSLDGDRVPPKPGEGAQHPHSPAPQGCSKESGEGPQPLFIDWLHSRPQSRCGNARKTLLENPGQESKPFHQACVLPPGARSIPSLMLFYFPSKVLCFIIGFLRSRSQTTIPLRGALALPPPRFVASFPVYCGFFCSKHIY